MDKINLNLFGLNYQTHVEKKDEKKADEEKNTPAQTSDKNVEQGAILNAMALSGAHNLTFAGINQINPKDYLDDASIARIQGSMTAFTGNIEKYTDIISKEFPGLNEAQIQALALKAVLKEV